MNAELLTLIASQAGMAERLRDEHRDDGTGHCRVCTTGAQAGRSIWPCSLYRHAAQVIADQDRAYDDAV